jgi:integrase
MQSMPRPIQSARLVFPASQGGYLNLDNWRRRVWKEAFKKTEISYRPLYQMRHTYATLASLPELMSFGFRGNSVTQPIQTTLGHYARFSRP